MERVRRQWEKWHLLSPCLYETLCCFITYIITFDSQSNPFGGVCYPHFRDKKMKPPRYPSPHSGTAWKNRKSLLSLDIFKSRVKKRLHYLQKNPFQWMQHRVTQRKGVRESSVWSPDTGFNKEHPPLCAQGYCSFYASGSSDMHNTSKKGKRHRDMHTIKC